MAEFKVGDTVRLKSGSPVMTISEADRRNQGSWVCVWFDGSKQTYGSFPAATLEPHDTKDDNFSSFI